MVPPADDDAANAERLLAEGRALRALARSLLGHDAVDDLVQESYAAALAAPAAVPRGLGPWLSGTVRHLAAMAWRTDTRRRAREHLAARDELDAGSDPAVIAAQTEVIEQVAAAVRALDEPFRTVVVLRFWHGLLPEAIAQRLAVPRNTVRSRLQRGLERLRTRLDSLHGGRERWSVPLLALAAEPTALVSGGAVGGVFLAGVGLLMKTKLLAVGVLLISALAVSWWMHETVASTPLAAAAPDPSAQPLAERVAPPPTTADEPAREAVPTPAPESSPTEVPFDPSPVKVTPWLARFLVVDEDEKPVADATVTIWAAVRTKLDPRMHEILGRRNTNTYSGRQPNALLELPTDPEGHASAMLEIECLYACASKGRTRTGESLLRYPRSSTEETKFMLEAPILLPGRVERADGSPGAGAKVTTSVNGFLRQRGQPPGPEPVFADRAGRFAIPVVRQCGYSLCAEVDGAKTFAEECFVRDNRPPEVVLSFPGAITLNGVVVDPEGKAVAEATVSIWRECHRDDPKQDPNDFETASAKSGADGRFTVAVRKHARYQLLASAPGHAKSEIVWSEPSSVRPHAEVRLQVQAFGKIAGVVRHADGSPFRGVRVGARADGPQFGSVAGPSVRERFQEVTATTSASDGSFSLKVHPGTVWSIVVHPVAEQPTLFSITKGVAPGRSDVTIIVGADDLAGCIVSGRVVLAGNDQPLDTFDVDVVDYDGLGKPVSKTSAKPKFDRNRFDLPPLPLGRTIAILVTPREAGKLRSQPYPPARLGPFTTSSAGIDLQVRIDAWGEQPVQALSADGTPARYARVHAVGDEDFGSTTGALAVDAEGRAVLKQCAPGVHKLQVWNESGLLLEQPVTILPGLNPEVVVRLPAGNAVDKGR